MPTKRKAGSSLAPDGNDVAVQVQVGTLVQSSPVVSSSAAAAAPAAAAASVVSASVVSASVALSSSDESSQQTLLYPGCGSDAYPLCFPHAWTGVIRQYVYFDSSPRTWPRRNATLPRESFSDVLDLAAHLRKWTYADVEVEVVSEDRSDDKNGEYTRLNLSDGRVIHFFSNVKDSDLVTGAAPQLLKDLVASASHLLVRGFIPCEGVYDAMPSLRHVHIAELPWMKVPERFQDLERRFVEFSSNYERDDDYDANCVFEDDERWRKVTCEKCENERENE